MSWLRELRKGQRRELRRIAALAYERELATALAELEEQFRRWRAGELGPHELNDAIHAFHQGPSRKLWAQYSQGDAELAGVIAIRGGVVREAEVEPDVLAVLRPHLEAYD